MLLPATVQTGGYETVAYPSETAAEGVVMVAFMVEKVVLVVGGDKVDAEDMTEVEVVDEVVKEVVKEVELLITRPVREIESAEEELTAAAETRTAP